jgi:hypothetical protein
LAKVIGNPRIQPFYHVLFAMRLPYYSLLALQVGCTFPNHRQDVTGMYRAVMPYRDVPAPNVALELTPDQAIYHAGSSELPYSYTVDNGTVYMQSEGARVGFRILSRDTLRQTDAAGNHLDYVRAH